MSSHSQRHEQHFSVCCAAHCILHTAFAIFCPQWKARFDAEMTLQRAKLERDKSEDRKNRLTGKQWFLQQEAQHIEVRGGGMKLLWLEAQPEASEWLRQCSEYSTPFWRVDAALGSCSRPPCHPVPPCCCRSRSRSWRRTRRTARTTAKTGRTARCAAVGCCTD